MTALERRRHTPDKQQQFIKRSSVLSAAVPTPDELCRDYAPRVYNLARRMLGNEADSQDVTQDILIQVLCKLPTFRGESTFVTWLHRVAVNAILAFRRKWAVREKGRVLEPMAEFTENGVHARPVRRWMAEAEKLALDQELQRLIEQAIGRLPVTYRDVYVLADVEGLPNPEIADMLQLSLPAVKSRLHRARVLMRNALAPYFEEESVCSVAGT